MPRWTQFFLNSLRKSDPFLKGLGLAVVAFYKQAFSPVFGGNCRFYPSCSCYAEQAFSEYDFVEATKLIVFRLCKCHPFGASGYDPLPHAHVNASSRCKG